MPGVYELADEVRTVIYIGQSKTDAPNRIRQHLARPSCVRERAAYWRYRYTRVPAAEEASLLDEYAARHRTLPECNTATPRLRSVLKRYIERSGAS